MGKPDRKSRQRSAIDDRLIGLATLVRDMRTSQREFQRVRTKPAFLAMQRQESFVDKQVLVILAGRQAPM